MANNTLNYEFNLEVNRASIEKLKQYFLEVEKVLSNTLKNGPDKEIEKSLDSARNFVKILNSAYNPKLGQFDMSQVRNEIQKSYGSMNNFKKSIESTSSVGAKAYNEFTKTILNTNLQLKQSNKLLDTMADTMAKTIRWGVASRVMNNMAGSIQKAWDFSVKLDKSLNDIRIVTDKSASDMERFAETANRAAKGLGASTRDYTEAALIFYQQGLNDAESQKRAEITLKAANVTGQSTQDVSEQLTAIWNGYKVSNEEAELYIDKVAAVAADTAADLEELATGMSKVASAANLMGVDIDQLNAQLATVVSVTRQAPESVGVAFKTIYARMGDIKAGLDDETTLGNYTSKMAELGVNVLDANGNLRDMGEVIEEIGNNWQNLSREQQINLSQTMAGVRQYNNLLALFDNWDMYTDALNTSAEAAGTLQHQQDIYMESVEAHLQKMKTEAEETYKTLFDTDTVNTFIDAITGLNSVLNTFLKGLGGGMNDFLFIGSTITQLLNKQIGGGINNMINNLETIRNNKDTINLLKDVTELGFSTAFGQQNAYVTEATTNQFKRNEELLKLQTSISEEEYNKLNNLSIEIAYWEDIVNLKEEALAKGKSETKELEQQIIKLEKQAQITQNRINRIDSGKITKQDVQTWAHQKGFSKNQKQRLNQILQETTENFSSEQEQEIKKILETSQAGTRETLQRKKDIYSKKEEWEEVNKQQAKINKDNAQGLFDDDSKNSKRAAAISDTIRGLSTLVQIGTSLSGIIKTLGDDEATVGEKASQIVSVLMANIPILLMNFKSLKNLLPTIAEATNKAAIAMGAEGVTAASGFGSSLMGVISVAGPYALAIGAVIGVAYALVKAYNADADAAKEAAENAKKVKEEYEDIKQSYKELTENVSKYGDSLNAIKKLEEGTQEWKEQVLELNEQVLKLLDSYPQLAKYVTNTNGALGFTQEGVNELLNQQWQVVQGAYRTNISAQLNADQKQFKSDTTNFSRGITYTQKERQYVDTKAYQVGQSGHYEEVDVTHSMSEGQAETLIEALRKNGLSILENNDTLMDATGFSKELTEALLKNKDEIVNLNTKLTNLDASSLVMRSQSAQSYLTVHGGDDFNKLSAEDQARISTAIAKSITEESVDKYRKGDYDKGVFGWSWLGGGKSDADIQKQYAKLMGYNTDNIKNKTGKAIYKDANDKEIEVSDKIAREALAQEAALKKAAKGTEDYVKAINAMTEAGNNAAKNLNLIGTEFDNTTRLLKTGFQSNFDFSIATDDQLKGLSNLRGNEEEWKKVEAGWKAAGYNSAAEFTKEFDKEMEQWNTPEKSAERAKNLAAIIEEQYNAALANDADALKTTESALRSYTEHLMETNEVLAQDKLLAEKTAAAAFKFADGVEALGDALDSNYDLLQDWRKGLTSSVKAYKAIGEVQDALEEMFNIRVSEDFINEHFEQLEELANGNVEALEELQDAAAKDYVAHLYINADDTRIGEIRTELNNYIDEFSQRNIEVGASIDDTDFINSLNNMIDQGELTSDQVQEYLNSMGYEPQFEEESASTDPQTYNATTDVNANIFGKNVHLATLNTSTAIDGVTATMLGIKNAESGSNRHVKSVKRTSNTAGRRNAVRNAGGSGRRGGSGSGGSSNQPDIMDPLEKEKDRYHDVNVELKLIQNNLDKLDKQKSKLFGQKLLDNLNKQWDLLNQKIETTNKKFQIAQGEAQELRNKLGGKGVGFNADGTISNYAQAYQAQLNYVNSLINQYNSMGAESQKGFKDTVEKAKKDFDQFVENINRYDTLITDMIPGLETDIQEAVNKQIDIQIQEFDMAIELRLDLTEATKDWNEFKKRIINDIKEDDILGNAQARLLDFSMYYDENGKGVIQSLSKQLNDTLAELAVIDSGQTSKVYGDDKNKALEDLKKYWEEAMKQMEAMYDLQNEINQSYLDMMDEAQEKFDKQIEAYETLTNIIDHDKNLVSLIYGDEAYDKMAAFYDKQHENYLGQLNFASQQVEFWREVYENAEEGSEAQEKAHENLVAATENLNGLLETSIEHLQDKYLNALNLIFQDLNKKVTNGFGLDYVEEEWTLINKNADLYLDKINQLYGIQSLESKYLDAINDNTSLTAQKKLKDIMDEELTALREKDKLTEYDLERANKRYEIALKEIALEEAQQNKTQLRLRRDSQGNYRYEYVNDAEEVKKLQDELDDLYNSLYNFDKEHYIDNLNEILDVWKEFQEKMKEAAQINDPEVLKIYHDYMARINKNS